MLRLLTDENFNGLILRSLKSRLPELDVVSVRQVGLRGSKDLALLRWAGQNNRTIITHDLKTMPYDAGQLLQSGEPMRGVIFVPQNMAIDRAIADLELVIACHSQEEFRDRTQYLPL